MLTSIDNQSDYSESEKWKEEKPLSEIISVVTGATRGAGKAISFVLGEAGSTVYVTGRTSGNHPGSNNLSWTVEDTAAEVTSRGGEGIPRRCDHTKDDDIRELFARVKKQQGHLDVLVNNVWGGYTPYEEHNDWFSHPLWEQSMERWEGMFTAGVRAHMVSNMYGIPLLFKTNGLIVSTSYWNRGEYLGLLFYDMAKCSINRMAFGSGKELQGEGITAVSISPGWMRVEKMYGKVRKDKLEAIESPEYLGRVILALALDKNRIQMSGKTWEVGGLAKIYRVKDIDHSYHDYHEEIRDPKNVLYEP